MCLLFAKWSLEKKDLLAELSRNSKENKGLIVSSLARSEINARPPKLHIAQESCKKPKKADIVDGWVVNVEYVVVCASRFRQTLFIIYNLNKNNAFFA